MIYYKISTIKNEAAQLVRSYKNGSVVATVEIVPGKHYIIKPDNPSKKRNRGRVCIVERFMPDYVKVRYVDNNRIGRALHQDLKYYDATQPIPDEVVIHEVMDGLPRFLPQEVPGNLLTRNQLYKRGLVASEEHVAYVKYPDQRREYKLYDVSQVSKKEKEIGIWKINNS